MMFKSLNGLAPVYLKDLFSERHTDYGMRDSLRDSLRKLNLPKPRTDYLKRTLAIAVPYYGILFLKILGRLGKVHLI